MGSLHAISSIRQVYSGAVILKVGSLDHQQEHHLGVFNQAKTQDLPQAH